MDRVDLGFDVQTGTDQPTGGFILSLDVAWDHS